jgi:hypothetical protein
MFGLNRPYRTQQEVQACLGERIQYNGETWICDSYNDLGCRYWRKENGKKIYTLPGFD